MVSSHKSKWPALIILFAFVGGYILAKWQTPVHEIVKTEIQQVRIYLKNRDNTSIEELQGPKKYFLDCGANVASSVLLFRETYPDAHNYIIHSFEIDEQLKPYFIPYTEDGKTFPHIPMAVSDRTGKMTAYLEGAWFPGKINNKRDMQWGGGTLFVHKDEKDNTDGLGGLRKLSRHVEVPMVDLSEWIRNNTRKEDYVILKLDVEGAEYGIVKKMLAENTFDWIDKFYGEFHPWQPTGYNSEQKKKITDDMRASGIKFLNWAGENKRFDDFKELLQMEVPNDTPGSLDHVTATCETKDSKTKVTVVIEVGMNAKTAKRLIGTIAAYNKEVSLTLFVYGDFIEQNANLVLEWSMKYEIGLRMGRHWAGDYWLLQNKNMLRMDIVSAVRKFLEIGLSPTYILPSGITKDVSELTKEQKLRIINSTFTFPPKEGTLLNSSSYFKFRDVERTPKALQIIHTALDKKGGILSLDSDFPDSYMISVFLLDYLFEVSPHQITSLRDCMT